MQRLDLRVLGSAAGGGFPQWNCACVQCRGARSNPRRFEPRTQDSVAVATRPDAWFLLNASPDVTRQIEATPALWPAEDRRSPIAGVVLTNGDADHVLGLFQLREWHPMSVYATRPVLAGLGRNALAKTLARFPGHVVFRELELERRVELIGADGAPSGVSVEAFAAPGKPPLHLVDSVDPSAEDNVALRVSGPSGGAAVYASAVASLPELLPRLRDADLLLLDGTFWSDDEPRGFGAPGSSRAMGHAPIGGEGGSLSLSLELPERRLYTHINNTNPVLDAASDERRIVEGAGWQVARDGLAFSL